MPQEQAQQFKEWNNLIFHMGHQLAAYEKEIVKLTQ